MRTYLSGIDVLVRGRFAQLQGSRVGLVTNHTGRTAEGQPTVDALHEAGGVTLAALFGPEHGIRGNFDENVADAIDPKTGLPIYSLFGTRNQPSEEQLDIIDTLVFDIQDIGCRFYTYISTLGNILEAASACGKRVVVLDRPNPITGTHLEGPLADPDKLSFVAYHPIPLRHGMTTGELARLFHAEKCLACPLEIIRCEGWQRKDWFDATGLLWTNPSPNIRRLTAAALYPGVGLLEFTNVSVGRGTDTPFEIFGAPYLNARAFAAALNLENLPGARFVPVKFTPTTSVYQGQSCGGVQIVATNRKTLNAVQLGMTLATTLRDSHLGEWQPDKLITLLVNQRAYDGFIAGQSYAALASGWAAEGQEFVARREGALLY